MKITIRFKHNKKSKDKYWSPSTFHFDEDCSTGPVIARGDKCECVIEIKRGDVLEFSTTKFSDEANFNHWRDKKLVNGADKKGHPVKRL